MTPLVLASTSIYRHELLTKLGLPFQSVKPNFDEETAKTTKQKPRDLCLFLGQEKARSLSTAENCVIGSDQMVVLDDQILGKPGSISQACLQLKKMSGKKHELLTSVSIYYQGQEHSHLNITSMTMQTLSEEQILKYVQLDQPLDCAGSYKIEKNGISLFDKIETDDFTAIQGLPLLKVSQILRKFGYKVPFV